MLFNYSGSIPQLSNDIKPAFYHNIVKPLLVRMLCYYNDIVNVYVDHCGVWDDHG